MMADYAEGQRLQGSDGKIYVVRNGVPVSEGPSPLIANPKAPYEGAIAAGQAAAAPLEAPKAAADITNTQAQTGKTTVDAATAKAVLPYVGPKAAAEMISAQEAAHQAQLKTQQESDATAKADLEKYGGQVQVDQLISAAERAKRLVRDTTTGAAGSIASRIPGTDAYDLKRIIEQDVRGNVFLQRLSALKEENPSPNGGTGIGRIMQAEIPMITGSSGALDIGMKPSELTQSLNQIEQGALRMKAKVSGQNPDDQKVLMSLLPETVVADEVKRRIQSGEDPADTAKYLMSVGRKPDKGTIAALLANRGNQNPDVRPPQEGGYPSSYLAQGISGANEGLAGVLGAPADLARSAINLVPEGINAIANTHIPTLPEAIGGGDWWKRRLNDAGSIQPPTSDPSTQFVRRVGESVGASAVPGMFGGTLPKMGAALLSGLGSGIGGATAQQVAPGNPLAEMAGEVAGGGLTGFGIAKAAQRSAQRGIETAVPTVDELKGQAADLYRKAEQRGVTATPEQTQQLADDFRATLQREGQIGPKGAITSADTNTTKAYNLLQQYAGQPMKPTEMNTVRTVLADSRKSSDPSDRRLGSILLDQFDNFVSPLAPEFGQARAVASRYLQAQDLEKARELAGAKASQFTGSGFENALRTEYRGLDRGNIKGQNYFAPDVTEALQQVSRGTPASNTLRGLGRLAPTGVVSGMGSVIPGLATGGMFGGPAGASVGAGLAGLGIGGRIGATRMGIKAADNAEFIARNGGKLDQAPLLPKEMSDYLAWANAVEQAKYLNQR